jgi:hypothetical protein
VVRVAIIGTGISGTTLALRLQQLGIDTTLFTDRPPSEHRNGRIDNLVARFPATRQRERILGVAHWDDVVGSESIGIDVTVTGTPIAFRGRLDGGVQAVDFRVYLSGLLEDYAARGGSVVVGPLPASAEQLTARSSAHDIFVVAAGRSSPLARSLFPVRPEHSPFASPQRTLVGGLCTGLAASDPPVVSFNIVPGLGEIFSQPFLTRDGVVSSFLVEAVPEGPLDVATGDVESCAGTITELIRTFAPSLACRLDERGISLLGPLDVLAGAITPTVRRGWSRVPDGRLALAIGDAWIVNDPIIGQGANIGSHCAWAMAEALAAATAVDDDLGRRIEERLWSYAGPVTALNNAFLRPPPAHVLDLFLAATEHQAVADAVIEGFADPVRLAHTLASPRTTTALVASATETMAA